jgi:uncharacterized membrane protein YecN with MAPEG domain
MIQNKKTLRKTDLAFGAVLFVLALFFLGKSLQMNREAMDVFGSVLYTAPGFLPAIVSIILMILGLTLMISAWREGARLSIGDFRAAWGAMKSNTAIRIYGIVAMFGVYIFLLIGLLPFAVATFLYLFGFMLLFKAGHWLKLLFISALSSLAIVYVFQELVNIPLP